MRDRLIKLILNADCDDKLRYYDLYDITDTKNGGAKYFADYLIANGVVVPPCKVGDTVYEVQPIRKRIQAYEVTTIKYNGNFWWLTWIVKDRKGWYGNVEGFNDNQIGKTVFLTKEEAERALKGGAEE